MYAIKNKHWIITQNFLINYIIHLIIATFIAAFLLLLPNEPSYRTDYGTSEGSWFFLIFTIPLAILYNLAYLLNWSVQIIRFLRKEKPGLSVRKTNIFLIFSGYIILIIALVFYRAQFIDTLQIQ